MNDVPRLVPAGDRALFIEFEERIDVAVNVRAVALADALRLAAIPGVQDIVPAFRSVGVHFDPLTTDYERLIDRVNSEVTGAVPGTSADAAADPIDVPVCYGLDLGPDLGDVARFSGLTEDEVIDRHVAPIYRVFMLGFTPGFAYIGPVDPKLAVPRRATPRTKVPAGSVAIAGGQTGIYPLETPGGWHLIGRTPLRPYDASRGDAWCLFKAGDRVRFQRITRDEYASAAVERTNS